MAPLVRAFAVALSEMTLSQHDPSTSHSSKEGSPPPHNAPQDVQLVLSARKDGTLREVRRAISQTRIGDRVLILEGLERDEERALVAGALAFIYPARQEGAGLTTLEAMALGIPVVATRDGALPEVCSETGLFADPDSTLDFAAALQRILTDEKLRARLSDRGREVARKRDSMDAARLVREIYQDLY